VSEKLEFDLHILKMKSFGRALAFVETRTAVMHSCTLHLARKPTPPSSPDKNKEVEEEDKEVDEVVDNFASVKLEEHLS
jgi:hypothetical protein